MGTRRWNNGSSRPTILPISELQVIPKTSNNEEIISEIEELRDNFDKSEKDFDNKLINLEMQIK